MASGQAFATDYYSTGNIVDGDLTIGAKWMINSMSCGIGGTAGTGTIAMATTTDTLTVCGTHSLNLTTGATLNAGVLIFDNGGAGQEPG